MVFALKPRSSSCCSLRTSVSRIVTSAPSSRKMRAALAPTIPAPRMTTLAGGTPGTPPRRMPWPPWSFCRNCAASGGDHPAGDLADRGQHRQVAVLGLDRLVGDGGHVALEHQLDLAGVRDRKVEEAEQDVPLLQQVELRHHGPRDGEDHLRPAVDLLRAVDDLRAGARYSVRLRSRCPGRRRVPRRRDGPARSGSRRPSGSGRPGSRTVAVVWGCRCPWESSSLR